MLKLTCRKKHKLSWNTSVIPSLPATSAKLEIYELAQKEDAICAKVREYCQSSWPKRDAVECALKAYWKVRKSLTVCDDILLYNNHIVVPAALRETLSLIHQGHQGVERNRSRARVAVWWPCVGSEVKQYVESCRECAKQSQLQKHHSSQLHYLTVCGNKSVQTYLNWEVSTTC